VALNGGFGWTGQPVPPAEGAFWWAPLFALELCTSALPWHAAETDCNARVVVNSGFFSAILTTRGTDLTEAISIGGHSLIAPRMAHAVVGPRTFRAAREQPLKKIALRYNSIFKCRPAVTVNK
jgi:hypothetical protein